MKFFANKRQVVNKIGAAALMVMLSMTMLTGCGSRADRNSDEVSTESAPNTAGMVHLDSADDVTAFMDEVYGGVAEDLLPMDVTTTELDMNDEDMIEYQTGLTDISGVAGIYLSESMITSTAYSAVYIRTTDEADAEQVRQQLMDSINPSKWICVTAEKQSAAVFGNDVFFVMGYLDTVDAVMDKAIAAAQTRGMKTSDTIEKVNPI